MAMFPEPKTFTAEEIEKIREYIIHNNDAENVAYISQTNFHVEFQGIRDSQRILFKLEKTSGLVIEESD